MEFKIKTTCKGCKRQEDKWIDYNLEDELTKLVYFNKKNKSKEIKPGYHFQFIKNYLVPALQTITFTKEESQNNEFVIEFYTPLEKLLEALDKTGVPITAVIAFLFNFVLNQLGREFIKKYQATNLLFGKNKIEEKKLWEIFIQDKIKQLEM